MNIESLAEFVDETSSLRDEWFPTEQTWGPWFRGQANATWHLIPGLYRHRTTTRPDLRYLEDELRQEFLVRAPNFTNLQPRNPWAWYFLMRHSLAPTRLLDWTEGALIALYFAVRDNVGNLDAAVWALDPWWLNKRVLNRSEVYSPETMSDVDLERYKPWLPVLFAEDPFLPELPIAVYPAYSAQRISTQRSCFTLHGRSTSAFQDLSVESQNGLRKFTIAASCVSKIRKQLLTCGVDEVTVYPDLDGLGRYLSFVAKTETGS
jgi:FRG domain